ncbi:hypothetical protein M422DRAFT_48246 [Sphaerobolus stellatus SS14]|uniref:Uncharacterized protein n=1 Tax=Sphaerobolus stellatus (strain SS14) TaxID=990650 RepID=A0A0C9UHC2_SPHS4|nr:hypothetical protein M422DRAFT_48246 [Sphaerobolus stellatus SS14]
MRRDFVAGALEKDDACRTLTALTEGCENTIEMYSSQKPTQALLNNPGAVEPSGGPLIHAATTTQGPEFLQYTIQQLSILVNTGTLDGRHPADGQTTGPIEVPSSPLPLDPTLTILPITNAEASHIEAERVHAAETYLSTPHSAQVDMDVDIDTDLGDGVGSMGMTVGKEVVPIQIMDMRVTPHCAQLLRVEIHVMGNEYTCSVEVDLEEAVRAVQATPGHIKGHVIISFKDGQYSTPFICFNGCEDVPKCLPPRAPLSPDGTLQLEAEQDDHVFSPGPVMMTLPQVNAVKHEAPNAAPVPALRADTDVKAIDTSPQLESKALQNAPPSDQHTGQWIIQELLKKPEDAKQYQEFLGGKNRKGATLKRLQTMYEWALAVRYVYFRLLIFINFPEKLQTRFVKARDDEGSPVLVKHLMLVLGRDRTWFSNARFCVKAVQLYVEEEQIKKNLESDSGSVLSADGWYKLLKSIDEANGGKAKCG